MSIELLELRIAPAGVFTFTDVDGDIAKITSSRGTNADLAAAATVVAGQLRSLDLTAAIFQNANITAFVVTKSAAGDGLVNIGRIDGSGRDLGNVTISGDLGSILCGDGDTTTPGLDLLSIRSMGIYGTATQGGGSITSAVEGPFGTLKISGDLKDASIGARSFGDRADGRIGSVSIGGSLDGAYLFSTGDMGSVKIARDLLGGSAPNSGVISCGGSLASLTIGGSVIGGSSAFTGEISAGELGAISIGGDLVGGSADVSGLILSSGKLKSLTIGGSLIGGIGNQRFTLNFTPVEGQVIVLGDIGTIRIAGDIVGATGLSTAKITGYGAIQSLTVGRSVLGGSGEGSAAIESAGDITALRIVGDLKGGSGNESAKIEAGGKILSATIGGSFLGGSGDYNTRVVNGIPHIGQIFALGGIGPVKIGGDVIGGSGIDSAGIVAGHGNDASIKIGAVSVAGSIFGGAGNGSGGILSAGSLGAVKIGGSLAGGTGDSSASVSANGGALTSVTIGGSFIGGGTAVNASAGFIFSRGDMGAVVIGGDVLGGVANSAGRIFSFGKLASVRIGGSLVGGTGDFSGSIASNGALGSVTIAHDLLGGSIPAATLSLFGTGAITSLERIGSITIGGSIISGVDGSGSGDLIQNATIRAGRDIGSLTVRGGLIGNVTPAGDSPVIISAVGQAAPGATTDLAIGKISIGGRVERAQIFAGRDLILGPQNADAQIGSVKVGGDWIASSIVAGALNLGADNATGGTGANADGINYGDAHDVKILGGNAAIQSRIGSITIAGHVFGTPESFRPDDSFGFVAEQIGALKVAGRTFTLNSGAGNDGFTIARRIDGILDDATLHEIGAGIGFSIAANSSAKLVNASTVTYQDADGDKVTVKLSKPLLTAANVNNVFRFDAGLVDDGMPRLQQLRFIDLRPLASNGLGVTVTVVAAGGDGLAHVGAINSGGFDVGAVQYPRRPRPDRRWRRNSHHCRSRRAERAHARPPRPRHARAANHSFPSQPGERHRREHRFADRAPGHRRCLRQRERFDWFREDRRLTHRRRGRE